MAAKGGGSIVLKLGMIASLLVAAAAGGSSYYYGVAVPERDGAAETAYQACLGAAGAAHESSWAAQCQRLADENARDRADCLSKLNLSKAYCDASYPARDGSAHCTLPDDLATVIDAALARSRNRCQREREAAAPR